MSYSSWKSQRNVICFHGLQIWPDKKGKEKRKSNNVNSSVRGMNRRGLRDPYQSFWFMCDRPYWDAGGIILADISTENSTHLFSHWPKALSFFSFFLPSIFIEKIWMRVNVRFSLHLINFMWENSIHRFSYLPFPF